MVNKNDRARQFMPFDALKGYKEAILEKQKVIVEKKEVSEDDAIIISRRLNEIKIGDMIKIVYYDMDEYVCVEGLISKVNIDEKYLMVVKRKISFKDIKDIEIINA